MMNLEKYLEMQFNHYQKEAGLWSLENKNPVVGGYELHNKWKDYDEYLFKGIDTANMIALDYGTGPGRNIIKFRDRFVRIDGVDIGEKNIENAKINLENAGITDFNLYVCDGKSTPCKDNTYDMWFSTITLQHIASYDIRFAILSDAYRILKRNGHICFQMAYGGRNIKGKYYKIYSHRGDVLTADYYDNAFDAKMTNGYHDVSLDNEDQIIFDLEKIGFSDISTDIRSPGPGCSHKNWIYVRGMKK